jgi:hypothetical protein
VFVSLDATHAYTLSRDILTKADIEKLKRLQLSLRRRRIKLEGLRDPRNMSHTPQTPGSQYLRRSESRPTMDIVYKARSRSLSESSGWSSGSDIPYAGVRDNSEQVSPDGRGDTDVYSGQQENSTLAPNSKGAPVPALVNGTRSSPSIPPPLTQQTRDDTQGSRQVQEEKSVKHRMYETQGLMQPPPKKPKVETTPSPADLETLNLGKEMATWNEKLDKPVKKRLGPEKPRKGCTRTRKNFTEYEKEHAPAWFKAQVAAMKTPSEIERAYFERFGVFHRFLTTKLFVDRMDEKAARQAPKSKIVVLVQATPTTSSNGTVDDNSS